MSEAYQDGWDFAECDWNDLVEYNPDLFANHYDDPRDEENFVAGYYAFWREKDFKL